MYTIIILARAWVSALPAVVLVIHIIWIDFFFFFWGGVVGGGGVGVYPKYLKLSGKESRKLKQITCLNSFQDIRQNTVERLN